ncbi:membrane fusion protein (multidrug efflux system) [Altererythrobacter atlanticus]|uniref:Multidrug resistance protein EmrK n=1 Tax=Croceibacterium atlanticum TaxID=1267766 RepID=A0A0F7KV20_9SPHN|nr:HlyD family secretion protein [Croceibacterium atlanticum]AKH42610.1 putative multidrug resistance protein EmrK [Croceibacterium atlanticum]MBB5731387.1 membrane fusion protein (multidrug efflux system) [Croceibacterium atlanticum]
MTEETTARPEAGEPAPAEEAKTSPLKRKGVRRALLIGGIVILILLGLWFVRYWTVGRYLESTDDAYVQADAVVVSPKIGGYVEEIMVAENQQVEAGDPLFRIDARDYRSRVAQAQAQIDMAEANAAGLRAQIAEQRAAVDRATAQLASARSELKLARDEVRRYTPLAESGAESRQTLATRQTDLERAEAAVAAARAELDSARRRVASLEAQVGQARAQAEGGEAQREAANVDLGSTTVQASISGRIGNKTVQLGQFVQPGTRTMSIVPTQQLYVTANFKETQLGLMRVGQPVTLEVDAFSGVEIEGRVESFAPGTGAQFSLLPPENATGNFTKIVQRVPVRISIDATPEILARLVPGMSVEVTVNTRSAAGSLDQMTEARGEGAD